MTSSCIILLGPNAAQCERARDRGLHVVVLDTPERLAPGVIDLADDMILTDYTDTAFAATLLAPFVDRYSVVGVLSLTEYGLLASACLNAALGFEDNTVETVERVVNKDAMRAWLSSNERYQLPATIIDTPEALDAFVAEAGYPTILKPTDGSGSEGIVRIDSDDAHARWAAASPSLPVLAERFVVGAEYSVEAYSRDGEHTIVAVTEKAVHSRGSTNQFVESGHCVPARIDDALRADIDQYIRDFLTLIGIRWGLSHTEVIVGDAGFTVVETHTRNGGDRIVDLVQQATGVDLLDAAIAIRADQRYEPETLASPQAADVRFLMLDPGTITAINGAYRARTAPGVIDLQVHAKVGDRIGHIHSSDDRAGMIVVIGATAQDAIARAERAARMIRFTISTK